jgi:hydrogenase maturation protein HypF
LVKNPQHVPNERWRIRVRGIVQGVGFRPFVFGLATRYKLSGFVLNDSEGVLIEAEGSADTLNTFCQAIRAEAPPLARVESIEIVPIQPARSDHFEIQHSVSAAQRATLIAPDSTTCADCLQELFDPADRRYYYPFLNCTNCGPRFTIIGDIPYDRPNTTMRSFAMCAQCQAEYDDPRNRRFHAQPNACPACGPQLTLQLLATSGEPLIATAAITHAAELLQRGQILAIKGLGGYHLACDAWNAQAVGNLRRRKQREAKPFALMVPDLATAQQLCLLNAAEIELISSVHRPIVLAEQQPGLALPAELAPGCTTLGIMLPYTPLHHVLLHAYARIQQSAAPVALVMTSGNISEEPIAYQDTDAANRLAPIADAFLQHNRAIETRCDDSVARIVAGGEQLLRRARGYAPEPIRLAQPIPQPILAYGGHLKNTFCLARGQQAFLSHHIGDLDNLAILESFRHGIQQFQRLFAIVPEVLAYDLHPEYLATKEASASAVPTKIGVQHHHAHIASVIAEHNLEEPVIGIAADGTGYGPDGTIWGGEILIASAAEFTRVGHLATMPLPGGDQAVRQPWRVAAALLHQIYGADFMMLPIPFTQTIDPTAWRVLATMIERRLNSPQTSSIGRLFDAVAALIGIRNEVIYEGQAAIELERIADPDTSAYPYQLTTGEPFQIQLHEMIVAIIADLQRRVAIDQIAGRFHQALAQALVAGCLAVRQQTSLNSVALSGGVFQNRLLLELLMAQLQQYGFRTYINRRVPPNDGGLSFGQLVVAAAQISN